MDQGEKFIGYLKYSGKSVEDGFLDARKSAEALLGFDEVLRFFLLKEDPSLKDVDFEIPVKIRKGSWEMVIPEIIDKLLSPAGVVTTALGTYATITAKKAAEDGLFSTGAAKDTKATFRAALKSARWVIKIGSHMGSLTIKEFKSGLIIPKTQEVEILNDKSEPLRVPKKYLDLYKECPQKLFSKNAGVIEADRTLELGVFDGGAVEMVCISEKQKNIYYTKNDDGDNGIVLPELKHGQFVELEGVITRVTESTNTIGFDYQGHTLTCKPEEKRLASFKDKIISKKDDHVLPKIKIVGRVDRNAENGEFKEKRPQIIFSSIVTLESGDFKQRLL
jgi:hypothetical protein